MSYQVLARKWRPRRFSELREGLPGISANVLTQRLEGLEAAGVLTKHKLPPPASAQAFQLANSAAVGSMIYRFIGGDGPQD